jgi:hypothetical protein
MELLYMTDGGADIPLTGATVTAAGRRSGPQLRPGGSADTRRAPEGTALVGGKRVFI